MPNKNIQNTYGTIREMLQVAGALYKKQTAIEQKAGGSYIGYSYAQLCEDAKKLGSALYKKLGSGAHVMLIGENGYELVISYLAVTSYVGAVVPMPVSAGAQNVSDAAIAGINQR